jgi:phage terminase large subunit-like protein
MTPEVRALAAERMRIAARISAKLDGPSKFERLARSEAGRAWLRNLSPLDATRLLHSWEVMARPKQLLPATAWEVAVVCAGRGFGKTRLAAEFVRAEIGAGRARSIALIGPTEKDVARYMVGGRRRGTGSGLLDVLAPWERARATVLDAKKEIRIGDATIYLCSGEDRELRGAGLDLVWFDEPIKVARVAELLDNIMLALRDGTNPRLLLTTTPKANADWLRELIVDPGTIVRRGSTTENSALSPAAVARMQRRFADSRLAAQELDGELLSDAPGSIFKQSLIDQHRVPFAPLSLDVAIGIDPSKSGHVDSDECGIVVVGRDSYTGHCYVLADGTQRSDPAVWVRTVAELWRKHSVRSLVIETNNLGKHAIATIRAYWEGSMPYTVEVSAIGDKLSRAEPLSVRYEQGRIHHVGVLPKLEAELVDFAPGGRSPNGLDALGHAVHHLTMGYSR